MSEQDPYAVLGVPRNATDKEIRNAYISRCKVLHPDRFDPKTQPKEWAKANEMHAELNHAYATLRNASQRSATDTQPNRTENARGQATPPAPHRPKRPFTDGRILLGMLVVGFWGLYLGATSLWRESGIDKVPHHLSLTELLDGTVPNNRMLKVSDAKCDLGHGVAYLEHSTPQAYYIPLVTPSGRLESETPPAGRRIILRLTKKLYDAHSGALQNAGAPLTVEGIRLLNTDIESRIEEFLKKELSIANLNNVVVIDGGRQPIGSLLPIKVLIISSAWLLMLFFNFAKKPKLAWSAIAVLCGAFAIVPDRLWLEPDYESPLVSQATNAAATSHPRVSQLSAAGESIPSGLYSATSLKTLRKAAAQGDAVAQGELGHMYAAGDGVPEDAVEAVKWYRKAAEQGHAIAQRNLGFMYERGDGVAKDAVEAAKWLRKAAEQGDVSTQNILGSMYQNGDGVAKDPLEAAKWYRKAAEQGHVGAQNTLGIMYETGDGVPEDAAEAVKWFRKAAEQGNAFGQSALGSRYQTGDGVPKDVVEAVKWYRKAAEQGDVSTQNTLGYMYKNGDGVAKDAVEAVRWYRKAAERGNPAAQISLGSMYETGDGVSKDAVEAVKWYRKAADWGDLETQVKLGIMYGKGEGVAKDAVEAAKWFRKAAEREDAAAQHFLGIMYASGEGIVKDAVEAAKWFRKAAEQGHAGAQANLGSMYESGEGVPKDNVEAIKWYRKAAEQGHRSAQVYLGLIYTGNEIPKNAAEAAKWYRKAAERGDASAQNNLGAMYVFGEGVAKDAAEATKWFRKAAEQGDATAQRNLGDRYNRGDGVAKNAVEAAKWLRKAAEQGDDFAQKILGAMYVNGVGVAKDPVEAVKWLRKAAEKENVEAQLLLGALYESGRGVPKDEIEALAWYYIAAASGGIRASERRTSAEQRLGQQMSLLAQQRSKEILSNIQAAKTKSARITQSEQLGEADREATPKHGQSGTGVFVTTDGLILTAAHVLKGVSSIQIQTSHGVKPGRLVKVDTKNDLALIRCEGNFQPAPVKAPRDVKLGQAVFTIGFPNVELQGVSPKMTRGEISSLAGLQDDPRQWQISVPVQPGNSGGPLFDEAGNVIGVIVAKLNAIKAAKFTGDLSQNVNYAVKSAPALQLLAPYSEKLVRERQVNPSDKVETVVEQCRESVVLIFGYGP